MKIFLDTEFTGLHQYTTLISIGIISEFGDTFYAEFTDYDKNQVDNWIQENVINNLCLIGKYNDPTWFHLDNLDDNIHMSVSGNIKYIKMMLDEWFDVVLDNNEENNIEIWSDCLSYDWVLFNQLYGNALNLPDFIYYIPFDICTFMKLAGVDPDISREEFIGNSVEGDKHNSLYDAKVIKACYDKLIRIIRG